jgi:hypothetical protein
VADIFISYSKQHPQPTRDLATYLEQEGYTVWWDSNLIAGNSFRKEIDRQLGAADTVIVMWTPVSVVSDWVRSEVHRAQLAGKKLIPLRTRDLDVSQIPLPYGELHTDFVDDHAAILRAVRRVVGQGKLAPEPKVPNPTRELAETLSRENELHKAWQPCRLVRMSKVTLAIMPLSAILLSAIAVWWGSWFYDAQTCGVTFEVSHDSALAACNRALGSRWGVDRGRC